MTGPETRPRNGGSSLPELDRMDGADLLALDLPPLRMIVPDLIPEGTTVLAAPPKIGKSCLVYQMAVEVAIGGELFGQRVATGSVLYLALEDGKRRGSQRLAAALAGRTLPRGRLDVQWSARKIGEGLEDDIRDWLDLHPDAAMVAIDTLGKVRARSSGGRNAYELDVEDIGRLQDLFRDRPVALVIVHHIRKDTAGDYLVSVSGTFGLTGSVDTTMVIRRKRLERFGTILATGRDIAEAEVSVQFDGMTWQAAPPSLGEATFERAEVYRIIEESGPIFPAAIAQQTGQSRQSVANIVNKLVESGAVVRRQGGYQIVPPIRLVSDGIPPGEGGVSPVAPVSLPLPESHQSNGGDTREGPEMTLESPHPHSAGGSPDRAPPSVSWCRSYALHQSVHRQVATGVWWCDRCQVPTTSSPFQEVSQ